MFMLQLRQRELPHGRARCPAAAAPLCCLAQQRVDGRPARGFARFRLRYILGL